MSKACRIQAEVPPLSLSGTHAATPVCAGASGANVCACTFSRDPTTPRYASLVDLAAALSDLAAAVSDLAAALSVLDLAAALSERAAALSVFDLAAAMFAAGFSEKVLPVAR